MDKTDLKNLFDRDTAQERLNDIQGNIGGEPAILYLTDNFAYFKARDGGDYNVVSKMLDLKVDMVNPSTKMVITDNIVTLYRN